MATTPNNYLTLEQLRAAPQAAGLDLGAELDAFILDLIARASRLIDALCNQEPGAFKVSADETRYFTRARGAHCGFKLRVDALAAVPTTLAISQTGQVDTMSGTGGSYTTLSAGDYYLEPANALQKGQPFRWLVLDTQYGHYAEFPGFPRAIKVVGKFGFSTSVPALIAQATLIQVVRSLKRAQQGYVDAGAIRELASLQYLKDLDPDIKTIVDQGGFYEPLGW